MDAGNDVSYYAGRARSCLERARNAADTHIAAIHLELHDRYVKLLERMEEGARISPRALASIRGH